MNIIGFDYSDDVQRGYAGLCGPATLIAKARSQAEGDPCIFLDNGGFLQGNQLADMLSTQKATTEHPLVAVFNALKYDAVG